MKRIALLIGVLCLVITTSINAQTDVNKDIDVAKVYEQVVKEGYATTEVYLKLANAYYFDGRFLEAKKNYEKVFKAEQPTDKKVLFRYQRTLKVLKVNLNNNPYLSVVTTDTN